MASPITDYQRGADGAVYRYVASVWTLWENIRDFDPGLSVDKIDYSNRGGGGWKQHGAGLLDAGPSFQSVYSTDDTHLQALRTAFFARTPVQLAFMSEAKANTDSKGFKGHFTVIKFNTPQPLTDGQMVDIELAFAPDSTGK